VVAKNNMGVIRPFIITYHGTSKSHSITEPIPTVLRNQHHALTELVVKKEGNIENLPVIRTPDDIDNHDFKRPFCIEFNKQKYLVDITLRMLEPRELARSMSFPESFRFEKLDGSPLTKSDSVRMIGNACPVNTVRELVKTVINARKKEFKIK
jgi:site-specific DNA-cytosine methylase